MEHLFFSISYMGCHPSHWRIPSCFKNVKLHHQPECNLSQFIHDMEPRGSGGSKEVALPALPTHVLHRGARDRGDWGNGGTMRLWHISDLFWLSISPIFLAKKVFSNPKTGHFVLDVFLVAWPIGVVRCYVFFCRTVPHHTYLKTNYFLVLSNVFWSSVLMRNPTMNCPQFFVLIWFLLAMPPIYTIWNDLKNAEWMVTWYWEG